MLPYKFQVPENSKKLRGQLFTYLYSDCDVKTISSADEIEKDRYLAFSHPFDNWVFDAIIKDKSIRYQYKDKQLFTIIHHKGNTFAVRNDDLSIVQKIDQNQNLIQELFRFFKWQFW